MTRIRVLLADDHALVRSGLKLLLHGIPGVEVVAEARDGREALERIASARPDVALLDVSMPGLNGIETARRVRQQHPSVRVVILSVHADEEYVLAALRAGASGYLLKDSGTTELGMAVQAAARGETYLSPAVSRHVIDGYVQLFTRAHEAPGQSGAPPASPLERLTPRQREVLQLVAEGRTTKEIATVLGLSVKTVETHRAALMKTLDIHDVAGLVRLAVRSGLIDER